MAKELYLTKRDQDFLVDLYDMLFLDMNYIKKVIYNTTSEPAIYRRLKKMADEGYIYRSRLPLMEDNVSGRSKNIYTLDTRGWKEVQEIIGECEWNSKWVNEKSPSFIHHQTMMSMVKAAFQMNEHPALNFYEWFNEKRSHWSFSERKNDVVRPDGSLLLQSKQSETFGLFAFELERSRQRPEVSIKKMQRYNRFCKEKAWKKQRVFGVEVNNAPRVVWVSGKENEMLRLIEHTKDVNTNYTAGVLYTTYDKITEDPFGKIFFAKGSKDPEKLYSLVDEIQTE